jgi:hypothetical protein
MLLSEIPMFRLNVEGPILSTAGDALRLGRVEQTDITFFEPTGADLPLF